MERVRAGPMDWTMDSKRRFARCKHYDAFLWRCGCGCCSLARICQHCQHALNPSNTRSGTEESAARGLRSVYERDPNPLCQTFPGVQRVLVRQLPGAWRGRPCKVPIRTAHTNMTDSGKGN